MAEKGISLCGGAGGRAGECSSTREQPERKWSSRSDAFLARSRAANEPQTPLTAIKLPKGGTRPQRRKLSLNRSDRILHRAKPRPRPSAPLGSAQTSCRHVDAARPAAGNDRRPLRTPDPIKRTQRPALCRRTIPVRPWLQVEAPGASSAAPGFSWHPESYDSPATSALRPRDSNLSQFLAARGTGAARGTQGAPDAPRSHLAAAQSERISPSASCTVLLFCCPRTLSSLSITLSTSKLPAMVGNAGASLSAALCLPRTAADAPKTQVPPLY